ncbi:hypothetical protein ACJIZ3_006904 [Penstemon smallii]|uniref:Phytocyanin domain-containing protein n=1 Tax=Penstemon smallii TaxID=265156 RepID=A0ABD3S914_9LAMI
MKMLKAFLWLATIAMSMNLGFAVDYSVGGPNGGWTQGIDYQTWASSVTFLVGDNLIFQYSLNHDVTEVSEADFDSCSVNNPLRAPLNGGTTTIPLTTPGSRYFICGTAGHCRTGMKVQIDTIAPSAPPPPTIPPPVPRPPPSTPPPVPRPPPSTPPPVTLPPPATPPPVTLPPPTIPPPISPPPPATTPSIPSPPPTVAPSVPLPPPPTSPSVPSPSPTPSVSRPISPSPLKSVAPTPSPTSSRLPAAPNALPPSNVPHALSPTVAQSPSTSLMAPPPSTANKVNAVFGLASGFGSILIMLLNF